MRICRVLLGLTLASAVFCPVWARAASVVCLDSLDLSRMSQDFGTPQAGKSISGTPISLNGRVYQYVNIDDSWEAARNASGEIQSNGKFPDMRLLTAAIHSMGLKAGIYSSPGPTTCAGYTASYQHEQQDANTYANWGFDYLKYDWCSYGSIAKDDSLPELQKPYQIMRSALDQASRDITFSLCQYGMGDVWKWGVGVGGNCWRTSDDINDSWSRSCTCPCGACSRLRSSSDAI